MECGSPLDSRVMRRRRVSSPSAANSVAGIERAECELSPPPVIGPRPGSCRRFLRILRDIVLDVGHLLAPSFAILEECHRPADDGEFIEAGLNDLEQRSLR